MFWLWLANNIYGGWAFHIADIENQDDLGLALIYYTFVMLSSLYFLQGLTRIVLFEKRKRPHPLTHKINNICLFGAMTAISVPTIVNTTTSMLIALYYMI